MELIRINNPFARHKADIEQIKFKGQSIGDLVIEHLEYIKETHGLVVTRDAAESLINVSLNGLVIPPQFWDATKPQENEQIVFMPVVGKGDTEKQLMNIAIIIVAAFIVGPAVATQLGFAAGSTGALITTAIVAAGTGMAIQAMTPTPSPKGLNFNADDFDASPTYGWAPHTTQTQGTVVPKFYGQNKLWGNVAAVHTNIDAGDDTKQQLNLLLGLGAGPVEGIVANTIKINDQLVSNFSDVTTEEKKGTSNQSIVSFFSSTKPEYRPNRIVTNAGGAIIYTTPDADFDDLEIELLFTRGLYFANNQGGLSNHSVDIKIEISVHDAASWDTLVDTTITDSTTSTKRVNYIASGTYTGGAAVSITNGVKYDIRVTKDTSDEGGSRFGDELRLGSVREVLNDDFKYPHTALLGVSALATGQLSGSLNVSCEQQGAIVNTYNGSAWTLQYSNNPAWVLFDVLTEPVITGDGGGTPYAIDRYDGINPSRLDIAKFLELADWCDETAGISDGQGGTEKRITFNGGFDVGTTRWEAALKVCEVARCVMIWNGIDITLAIDKAVDVSQLFTVGNIERDTFKQTWFPQDELASEIELHYRDRTRDYKRTPFTILDPNITNPASRITLELFGITSQTEAWRRGMHQLSMNRYIKSMVEFGVNIDAIRCTVGDRILVQHDIPEWGKGGRVVSGTAFSFVVDQDLTYAADTTYTVAIRKNDDTINERTATSIYNPITGVNTGAKQFQIANDFTAEYLKDDSIEVVDSNGNDKTYTVASATFGGGTTTITVNETVPDAIVNGGLFNKRRVTVSVAFTNTDSNAAEPQVDDVYSWGVQNLHAMDFRIKGMRKTNDQLITITAIEYNVLVYGNDTGTPDIASLVSSDPPESDDGLLTPPSTDQIHDLFPSTTLGPPTVDVPMVTNLTINNNTPSAGKIAWAADDGSNPILLTYKGVTYEIAANNSNSIYIYWDLNSSPTTFLNTSTLATAIGDDKWVMAINNSGTHSKAFQNKILHGGLIQAATITAAFGQIAALTVDTAEIANLAVDTLKIAGLAVETAKIADNATSIVESIQTDGNTGEIADFGDPPTTLQTDNIVSEGGVVFITAYFTSVVDNPNAHLDVTIVRDSTVLRTFISFVLDSFNEVTFSVTLVDTPGSGSTDYYIKATKSVGTDASNGVVKLRGLILQEDKGK